MHLATSVDNDLVTAWQAANGAAWCRRMEATITRQTCEANQRLLSHQERNSRCKDCGGLHDQGIPFPEQPTPVLAWTSEMEPSPQADNRTDEENSPHRPIMDDEDLEELLAQMFPEVDQEDSAADDTPEVAYLEDSPTRKEHRVPVYMGRCARCSDGYMSNVLETHHGDWDNNVYRCHCCGWRTSPEYETNRALFAAKGVI